MTTDKLHLSTDQRQFTVVYHDFLKSDKLDHYEKMIYIVIKSFTGNGTMQAFPSVKTISEMAGIGLTKTKQCLKKMKEKGVLSVTNRKKENGGNASNLYTLYDFAETWKDEPEEKEIEEKELEKEKTAEMVQKLEAKGYKIEKKETKKDKNGEKRVEKKTGTENENVPVFSKIKTTYNDNDKTQKSQEKNHYTMDDLKFLYDYYMMLEISPEKVSIINSILFYIQKTLNSTKKEIRVCGENMPKKEVSKKLLALTYEELLYTADKYVQYPGKIKNQEAYMLTLLYVAKEQMEAEIARQVAMMI